MWHLGVDLGWTTGASGVCALYEGADGGLAFHEWGTHPTHQAVKQWLAGYLATGANITLAIDAPLVIQNPTGARPVDKAMQRLFATAHAGVYPANQQQGFYAPITALVAWLAAQGFIHADPAQDKPHREMLEVYPHATTIRLFGLSRILKYKKGPLLHRQQALLQLYQLQQQHFSTLTPSVAVPPMPDIGRTLHSLKAAEDRLDALTCAYTGAWWAYHRHRGCHRGSDYLGDTASGFLVFPARQTD